MADRSSFGVRPLADGARRLAGVGLVIFGVCGVATAGWVYYDAWSTREAWNSSPEAAALAQQEAQPTPIRIDSATPEPFAAPVEHMPAPLAAAPTLEPVVPATPAPTVVVSAGELSLDSADFRFLDPPEPGAHARVAITVSNHAAAPSGRLLLGIPSSWFETYTIIGSGPAVSEDRTDDSGLRTFSFPPLAGGATATYELHVISMAEGTLAPAVQVLLDNGDPVGEIDKLTTLAPEPRPGPVMSIDIPRLKLHSGVVQTAWEPPPFTVGQIKGTAYITQGNTVLVGHLTGAAGNVFAHLDELKLGDSVTAVSRGVPYEFVVSRTFEGANTDSGPIDPADDSRLTLMTCAGVWNPFTHEYSKRLWIIAEPPDQAAADITTAAATATAEATMGAEATASAATASAVAVQPTMTPTPAPTPYAGDPSLPGGFGNARANLEKAFGPATGETSGKLAVFRSSGREFHIGFTPDPQRAALVVELPPAGTAFDAAVRESRKLFPSDTLPRASAPEGNAQFVVERFTSPSLAQALGDGDFSVIYVRDARGNIARIVLGLGDDLNTLIAESAS